MQTEPVIITDMSNDELAQWICQKADHIHKLKALYEQSRMQAKSLDDTFELIDECTRLCAIQIKRSNGCVSE